MADRGLTRPAQNERRFGSRRAGNDDAILMVDCPSGKVSVLALQDTGGTTRYLWFATDGDLRTGDTLPTAPNSDGSVVGGQS